MGGDGLSLWESAGLGKQWTAECTVEGPGDIELTFVAVCGMMGGIERVDLFGWAQRCGEASNQTEAIENTE